MKVCRETVCRVMLARLKLPCLGCVTFSGGFTLVFGTAACCAGVQAAIHRLCHAAWWVAGRAMRFG